MKHIKFKKMNEGYGAVKIAISQFFEDHDLPKPDDELVNDFIEYFKLDLSRLSDDYYTSGKHLKPKDDDYFGHTFVNFESKKNRKKPIQEEEEDYDTCVRCGYIADKVGPDGEYYCDCCYDDMFYN